MHVNGNSVVGVYVCLDHLSEGVCIYVPVCVCLYTCEQSVCGCV